MSCLEYAVLVLKVEHVVVCGHHGCGAVAGALALGPAESSLVNLWVADIRDTRNLNLETLSALPPGPDRVDRLVELNVVRQVFNVCTAPIVQAAWARGQKLAVHGLVYSLKDGLLRPLTDPVTGGFFELFSPFFFLHLSNSTSRSLSLKLSFFLKHFTFFSPGVAALQAHVDNEDEPGWPHATHHGHSSSRRSMELEGWSGPPSSADLQATEEAGGGGATAAEARAAMATPAEAAAATAAAEKTAATTTTMVGDVAAAMSAGARLGDGHAGSGGGASGGGSSGGGTPPPSAEASPPPPSASLPRPRSAAAIASAVAGSAGCPAPAAAAAAAATAAAAASNPSGRAVLPNSTACVATTTAALADGIAAHIAFASEDAAAAAEAKKRAREAKEAAAAGSNGV